MLHAFRVARYRFHLQFLEDASLPPYKGAALRGGFGYAFRRLVCAQHRDGSRVDAQRTDCVDCALRPTCPYTYVFETQVAPDVESPLEVSDPPRPFVFDVPVAGPTHFRAGETFSFDLVLIGAGIRYLPYFVLAFDRLGQSGIGVGREQRASFQLNSVEALHPLTERREPVYRAGTFCGSTDLSLGFADFAIPPGSVDSRVTLRFLTPTRLKLDGEFVARPTFETVARALLRRLSLLSALHCGEVWDADFQRLVAQAARVSTQRARTRWHDWARYSTRQRQRMQIGGFVGEMEYEGDIAPFAALLRLGSLVHIGKACVFGHGRFEAEFARAEQSLPQAVTRVGT